MKLSANILPFRDLFASHRGTVAPMTVLVVHHDAALCARLATLVRKAGHQAIVTNQGEDGLDVVATGEANMALVARTLPDMDVVEFTKHTRLLQPFQSTRPPVIALLADDRTDRKLEGAGLAATVLAKASTQQILDAIEAVAAKVERRPEPTPAPAVGFNSGMLDDLAEINRAEGFTQQFIVFGLSDIEESMIQLQVAAAGRRWKDVREHALAIKAVAVNLGLTELAQVATRIHLATDGELWTTQGSGLQELETARAAARAHLLAYMSSRANAAAEISGS